MEYYSPPCYTPPAAVSVPGGMLSPEERGERWGTSGTDG